MHPQNAMKRRLFSLLLSLLPAAHALGEEKLPDTVTYIADDAFYDSDDWSAKTHSALREIVLPQSLKTIGEWAFYHNYYLEKIDIPAGVTEIGSGAFAGCSNLSSITFQGSDTFLHGGAFGAQTTASAPLPGSSARFTMTGSMTTVRRTSSWQSDSVRRLHPLRRESAGRAAM